MPSGYHLYPDFGIVEVVDPATGRQVPDGTSGEIVFTSLDSRGSAVLRYRTGDIIEGGVVRDRCPHCARRVPRLVGKISRVSDHRRMQLGKIKGTLVDFNELEHLLDNCESVGQWVIELRKQDDDPLEVDELIVHAEAGRGGGSEVESRREITRALRGGAEISPNAIEFHSASAMRDLQGVGRLIKEQKILDNRPAASAAEGTTERNTHEHQVEH